MELVNHKKKSVPTIGHHPTQASKTDLQGPTKPRQSRAYWLAAFTGALLGALAGRFIPVGWTGLGVGCTPYQRAEVAADVGLALTAEQIACFVAERTAPSSRVAADCGISEPLTRALQSALGTTAPVAAVATEAADASSGE
jgi:hypothetical protein